MAKNDTTVPYDVIGHIDTSTSINVTTSVTQENVSGHQTLTKFINLLVPPVLVTLGVSCSAMTVLTMRTKHFRKVSTSVYMKTGALNDMFALIISLTAHWLYLNLPVVFVRTDSSHFMCKFFNFYGTGNNDFGLLLTAAMTAERATAIAWPFGASSYTVRRAKFVVAGLATFVVVKNLHFLLSSDMVELGRTDRLCDVYAERLGSHYETFYHVVYPWLHLAYVVFCGVVIAVSNGIILYHVKKSTSVRKSTSNARSVGHTWQHLVPMLIGESVLLFVLTFPFSMHLSVLAVRRQYDSTIYTDPIKNATETLVFNITFYMLYSNKCANFFMYCLTGRKFRDGLTLALTNLFNCKRHNKRSNLNYSSFTNASSRMKTMTTVKREKEVMTSPPPTLKPNKSAPRTNDIKLGAKGCPLNLKETENPAATKTPECAFVATEPNKLEKEDQKGFISQPIYCRSSLHYEATQKSYSVYI